MIVSKCKKCGQIYNPPVYFPGCVYCPNCGANFAQYGEMKSCFQSDGNEPKKTDDIKRDS